MAGATSLASANNILKEVYGPRIVDQLQSDTVALKRIEKTSEGVTHEVGGKYVTFPIRAKRNHGIGSRNENEPLPTPRTQSHENVRVRLAYHYGSISLTGQVMRLASSNTQAFASSLTNEMEGLRETLAKDTNRQVYGTHFGIMATIPTGSVGALTTHTVTSAQYLEPGMIVDVRSSDGTVLRTTENEILDISTSNVVTFAVAFDSTDDDIITRWRSYGKESIGFQEIVDDDTTVYEVNPTTVPVWKSVMDENGGTPRPLSEGMMTKLCDDIHVKGGKTTVVFTTLGVRRAYANLLTQQRKYVNTTSFEGGFSGLAFTTDRGEIPIVSDVDCQPNRMYFLNEKAIKLYQDADWQFMDEDGSKWQRVITAEGTFDAYQAIMYKYSQVGTDRRNTHGLLADITEAA